MSGVSDEFVEQYWREKVQQPVLPTWWVRFGKGQATGPFTTQEAALSFVFAELIHMGIHSGFRAVGQFTQEPVVYDHDSEGEVWRSRYDGAWSNENLVATWEGGGSAQIFKKVKQTKKGAKR